MTSNLGPVNRLEDHIHWGEGYLPSQVAQKEHGPLALAIQALRDQ